MYWICKIAHDRVVCHWRVCSCNPQSFLIKHYFKIKAYEYFISVIQSSGQQYPNESFILLVYKFYFLLSDSIIYISSHSKTGNTTIKINHLKGVTFQNGRRSHLSHFDHFLHVENIITNTTIKVIEATIYLS